MKIVIDKKQIRAMGELEPLRKPSIRQRKLAYWFNRGWYRAPVNDAIMAPPLLIGIEGIEYHDNEKAKSIVRDELLKMSEHYRIMADALLLPYDFERLTPPSE